MGTFQTKFLIKISEISEIYLHCFLGPSLPKRIFGSSIVPFGNSLILIGGYDYDDGFQKGFYKLTCSNRNCVWTKMAQELSVGRENFVAIPIPDDIVPCQ